MTSDQLQAYIDELEEVRDQYCKLAIKYIGRDNSVYDQYTKCRDSICVIKGFLATLKRHTEKKNEMAA